MAKRPPGSGNEDGFAPSLDETAEQLEELGRSLADAGERVAELEQVVSRAREVEAATLEAANRAVSLEQELGRSQQELAAAQESQAQDQEAMAEESKRREEWQARATEALARSQELEQTMEGERARADKLQAALAEAEAGMAGAATEVSSARLRAEAARRDAEAARLEAEATRHDVESARLEAEAARHDVESARLEAEALRQEVESAREQAKRFRDAAAAAFEQIQAMRSEWAPGDEGPSWLAEVLEEQVTEQPKARTTRRAEPKREKTDAPAGGSTRKLNGSGREVSSQTKSGANGASGRKDGSDGQATIPLVWSNAAKLALTGALGDCTTKRELLEAAGRVVGSRGGWDTVIAWSFDTRSQKWVLSTLWSAKGDEPEELTAAVGQLRPDSKTVVVRADAEGKLDWFAEPFAPGDDVLTAAGAEGMKTIAVMPLNQGEDTRAVLALCTHHHGRPSEELQQALDSISADVIAVLGDMRASDAPQRWGTRHRRR